MEEFPWSRMEEDMEELTKTFVKDQLRCTLCNDLFKMPILLPCYHSFCLPCVNGRVTKEKRRTLWGLFGNKEKYYINCDICGLVHYLSKCGVDTLVRNVLLENMVEIYREKTGMKVVLKNCQFCKDRDKDVQAIKYCFKCDLSYCGSCLQKFHPSKGQYAKHDLGDLVKPSKLRCPEHRDLFLDFYCMHCHAPTCSICKTKPVHEGHYHNVKDITVVYKAIKEELTSQTVELARRNSANKQFLDAMMTFERTAML
ncbi:E3 ubiquitin-protein ligase Midline-1-like [Glandiceps talaboti]